LFEVRSGATLAGKHQEVWTIIAQAALFLAGDTSRFLTGHNLTDHGRISAGGAIAAARPDRELLFHTIQASLSAHFPNAIFLRCP
jgi:hypothetical protein